MTLEHVNYPFFNFTVTLFHWYLNSPPTKEMTEALELIIYIEMMSGSDKSHHQSTKPPSRTSETMTLSRKPSRVHFTVDSDPFVHYQCSLLLLLLLILRSDLKTTTIDRPTLDSTPSGEELGSIPGQGLITSVEEGAVWSCCSWWWWGCC